MVKEWYSDLEMLYQKKKFYSQRPRIFFVNKWFIHGGASAIGNYILVRPLFKNAPKVVRLYLLAHEYGHIYCQHTYILISSILSFFCACSFIWSSLLYSNLWLLVFGILFLCFFGLSYIAYQKVERQADDVAIELIQAATMYEGCKEVDKELNRGNRSRDRLSYFKNKMDGIAIENMEEGKIENFIYNLCMSTILLIMVVGIVYAGYKFFSLLY